MPQREQRNMWLEDKGQRKLKAIARKRVSERVKNGVKNKRTAQLKDKRQQKSESKNESEEKRNITLEEQLHRNRRHQQNVA